MTAPLLEVENLGCRFGSLVAVNGLSFQVGRGEIVSLIGPNGAGKSTVFNLLTGYRRPNSGTVRFDGARIDGEATFRIARRGIARAFQIARPFRGLSVADNVRVGALYGRTGARDIAATVDEALALAGLSEIRGRPAADLTIGQLRKLEVARALATRPLLLLADEPLAGLLPAEGEEILASLRRLAAAKISVLLVEHDMPAVMKVSDRVIVLEAGHLIASGAPAAVARDPRVIQAYLGQEVA